MVDKPVTGSFYWIEIYGHKCLFEVLSIGFVEVLEPQILLYDHITDYFVLYKQEDMQRLKEATPAQITLFRRNISSSDLLDDFYRKYYYGW